MSKLRSINVSEKTEKKGRFSYLSWAWAVDKLIENHPNAIWDVKKFPLIVVHDGLMQAVPGMMVPYMRTDTGYYVEVEVFIDGIGRSQVHPVLNHQNKPIASPNTFEINTAIQRCLAKAIALHGLGLYIYAGEDLPPEGEKMSPEPINQKKVKEAIKFFRETIDKDEIENAALIQAAWTKLTNDERIEVQGGLKDKAPDCNKMYSSLLKEYLEHQVEVNG